MATSAESQILKMRARRLGAPPSDGKPSSNVITVLEFALAHERYAVEQKYVRRVSRVRSVTALPGVPRYVVGITFEAGRIISVVDLKAWFGLPRRGLAEKDPMLIVGNSLFEFAILADEVAGQRELVPDQIVPRTTDPGGERDPHIHGVTADGLIVVDLERILTAENIVVQ